MGFCSRRERLSFQPLGVSDVRPTRLERRLSAHPCPPSDANKYIHNLLTARKFCYRRRAWMKRSKGIRNKNRTLLRRKPRDRGKNPLGRIMIPYTQGQMVTISINPSIQKGMPHRRYHGRVGIISEKRGRAYVIQITTGKVPRQIIARPEHIQPMKEGP